MLPERFILHVFKELVDACLILRQGHPRALIEGWRTMVQNDLHIHNVFLDDRQPQDTSINPSISIAGLAPFKKSNQSSQGVRGRGLYWRILGEDFTS
ncbi:hypothetical protein K458DRAFT_422910 [Lentithecium fluviatile CBS 122367]|uniref:Uncharacterized protein n=1 Tax=Lentithecium fluviatile CBS 122367 TaxID=1168545 RepID=A0A6G1ILB9_9PLEO|nr:hypothetical protein K458DRAFT_422910 [Lentithecium fluviatile CBS 122367]